MAEWLLEHYNKNLNLTFTDLTYGDALAGSKRLYGVLSKLFEQYFHAIKPVKGEHMVCGTGVSAVLDQLTDKLCDVGESVLIARPYYSMRSFPVNSSMMRNQADLLVCEFTDGFDADVSARSQAAMQGVEIPADVDPASPETLEYFEAKLQELRKSGKNIPRAVVFCNPNNPLGKVKLKQCLRIQSLITIVLQGSSIPGKLFSNTAGFVSEIIYTCTNCSHPKVLNLA